MPQLIPVILSAAIAAGEASAVGIPALGIAAGSTAALVAGASTLALGAASMALQGSQPKAQKGPTHNPFGASPDEPRTWCYGRGMTSGSVAYWETVGSGNGDLYFVVPVHDTPCDGFEDFYVNNTLVVFSNNAATLSRITLTNCTVTTGSSIVTCSSTASLRAGMTIYGASPFAAGSKIYSVDSPTQFRMNNTSGSSSSTQSLTFNQVSRYCSLDGTIVRMYRYDHLGSETQTADATLVAASGGGTGYWTNDCRLQGVAYFVWKLQWRSGDNIYPQGVPSPKLVLRGRKVWDPRQDVAYGGVGSQTRSNEATWTWSQNAALCLLDYLLGVNMAGVRIGGCGVPVGRVDIDSFIAAANICDQSVSLASGGTEARYTINGFVDSIEDKEQVVRSMLTAMDGMLVYRGGQLALIAGAAQTSVTTLTDDDMSDPAGSLKVYPTISRQEKANTITSVYADPAQLYSTVSAPTLVVAQYQTDDGGLRLESEIRHRFTTSITTVQRLNKLALSNHREQLHIDAAFKPKALLISVGDTFLWSSGTAGYTAQKMICTQRDLNEDGSVRIIARQETDTKYSWATGEEQTPPTFNTNALLDPTAIDAPLGGDVSVTGVNIAGANSSSVPALLLTANLPPNPFTLAILTQWKLYTDTSWYSGPTLTPTDPVQPGYIVGLAPGVAYDVRFAYQTKFATSGWTTVSNVTAGGNLIATGATANAIDAAAIQASAVTTTKIADSAVTGVKITSGTIDITHFASSITAPALGTALPNPSGYTGPPLFFNETDGKLYRYDAGAWTAAVPTVDLTGTISSAQIAAASIDVSKLVAGLTFVQVVSSLPASGSTGDVVSYNGELYVWTGSAWSKSVQAVDITGQIVAGQIASASITTAKFAAGITPVEIVSSLPASGNFDGRQVYLTTDKKLYRYDGTAAAFKATTATVDMTGTISTAQIANNAVTAAQIAAATITASQLANGAVGTTQLAASAVTAAKTFIAAIDSATGNLTANSVTSTNIVAGSIVSADIAAGTIVASNIAAGAIGATQIAAGAVTAAKLFVGDMSNMLLNSDFSDAVYWTIPAGINAVVGGSGVMSSMNSTQILQRGGSGGMDSSLDAIVAVPFVVEGGKTYRLSAWCGCDNNFTGLVRPSVLWINQDGNALSFSFGNGIDHRTTGSTGSFIFVHSDTKVTAPATATSAKVYLDFYWGVTYSSLGFGYIGSPKFHLATDGTLVVDGSITAIAIASATITASNLAANTITAGVIAAGAIGTTQLAAAAVTAANIAAGTITSNKIAANTITASNLAANTITASQIASATITGSLIAAATITASNLVANTITAGQIASGTITATQIATGAITATQIATSTITTDNLIDNSVSAQQITSVSADVSYTYTSGSNGGSSEHAFVTSSSYTPHNSGTITITVNVAYQVSSAGATEQDVYITCKWDTGSSSGELTTYDTQVLQITDTATHYGVLTWTFTDVPRASSFTYSLGFWRYQNKTTPDNLTMVVKKGSTMIIEQLKK